MAEAKKTLEGTPSAADLKAAHEKLTKPPQAGRGALQGERSGRHARRQASGCRAGRAKQKKDEGVIDAEYVDVDDKK